MIRVIIFDFFDVFRTDGYKRWLKQHGFELEGPFLEASDKHDRGEYSTEDFFEAIAKASGETAAQVKYEINANVELNSALHKN
jgi:hypothetical protein